MYAVAVAKSAFMTLGLHNLPVAEEQEINSLENSGPWQRLLVPEV